MNNVMGIILTGGRNNRLKELSAIRSSSAIPVGGKYRAIDFSLSNMVNSGITNVAVLTQFNFRSLMNHLGSGKEWDLDRRYHGLQIFPPSFSSDDTGWYRGTADAMYQNIAFIKRCDEEYVVIAQGNIIYNMQFDDMLKFHINKEADITIAYRDMSDFSQEELSYMGILQLDDNSRITDFHEKPQNPKTKNGSMGIYIMKRELLISLLEECAAHGNYELVKDVFVKKVNLLKMFGYKYNGYWRNLSTIQTYFRLNMELLNPDTSKELLIGNGRIYTKEEDESPAKYNEEAEVRNSVIANGCIIEGTVQNSVLFRDVIVQKGAFVKNSIIMHNAVVEEGAYIENVIMDKYTVITRGKSLKGDSNWPVIVGKKVIV